MIKPSLVFLFCALAAPAIGQETAQRLSYGIEVAFRSGHSDRGFMISDRPVIQPVAWLSGSRTDFWVWTNFPLADNTDGSRPEILEAELTQRFEWQRLTIGPAVRVCSIYDPGFWWVERVWKLHPINFLHLFDGTPFKSVLWRLIGVRFGKRVFDDGVFISEPTLTVVGDECVLNQLSIIQCDSQEDGTYKSGTATIAAGCTIGVSAFVHYDVTMEEGSVLEADSFLMKGETVPKRARWGGNPAREL